MITSLYQNNENVEILATGGCSRVGFFRPGALYKKPKEGNLGDLSCGHNISLKLKSLHGESYNFVFYSPTFSLFELELVLGN